MSDALDHVQETAEQAQGQGRMASVVAILVALAATFMALCNVKDGNVVQAMAQAQTKAVDQWSLYQAKSMKQHLAETTQELLSAQLELAGSLKPEARTRLEHRIQEAQAHARRYEQEKAAIKAEAERLEAQYDALNVHDDQFDMAEAALSVGIALLGITLLARKRWLLAVACVFTGFGAVLGLAGFLHLNLHPDWLARLLG